MTNDRRPRRLVPLVLAVIAIALVGGESAGPAPASPSSTPDPGPVAIVAPTPTPTAKPSPRPSPAATPAPPTPLPALDPAPYPTLPPAPAPPLHIPRGGVPIVYYHRVESVPAGFGSWGSKRKRTFLAYDSLPTAFEAQLDWLQAHGYTTILPRDLAAHWDHGAPPAAAAGDPGLRRRVEDLAAQGAAGAQGPRDGRRVLPHARRDQARQPHLGPGPPARARGQRHRRARRPPRPARGHPAPEVGVAEAHVPRGRWRPARDRRACRDRARLDGLRRGRVQPTADRAGPTGRLHDGPVRPPRDPPGREPTLSPCASCGSRRGTTWRASRWAPSTRRCRCSRPRSRGATTSSPRLPIGRRVPS